MQELTEKNWLCCACLKETLSSRVSSLGGRTLSACPCRTLDGAAVSL